MNTECSRLDDASQIRRFLETEILQLASSMDDFDIQALGAARDMILAAERQGGRVHVTGIGKPGHLAGYIASLLSSTGTPAYVLDGTEAVHGSAGQVRPGDVVIAISNSGQTAELQRTVTALKHNGAAVIGLSRSLDSWLATHSDLALAAGVSQEGDSLNKPHRASILAEMVLLQTLSVLLQNAKGLTVEQYARWHPGGSLGQACQEELHGTV